MASACKTLYDMLNETHEMIVAAQNHHHNLLKAKQNNNHTEIVERSMETIRFYHSEDPKIWRFEKECKFFDYGQLKETEQIQYDQLQNNLSILDKLFCQIYPLAMEVVSDHKEENKPHRRHDTTLMFNILTGIEPLPENWDWNSEEGQYLENLYNALFNSPNEDEFRPINPSGKYIPPAIHKELTEQEEEEN
jgi:hypothetical protein